MSSLWEKLEAEYNTQNVTVSNLKAAFYLLSNLQSGNKNAQLKHYLDSSLNRIIIESSVTEIGECSHTEPKSKHTCDVIVPMQVNEEVPFSFYANLTKNYGQNDQKRVLLAFCSSNSECVFYKLGQGLGEPPKLVNEPYSKRKRR